MSPEPHPFHPFSHSLLGTAHFLVTADLIAIVAPEADLDCGVRNKPFRAHCDTMPLGVSGGAAAAMQISGLLKPSAARMARARACAAKVWTCSIHAHAIPCGAPGCSLHFQFYRHVIKCIS